jgi:hypothetical protein
MIDEPANDRASVAKLFKEADYGCNREMLSRIR